MRICVCLRLKAARSCRGEFVERSFADRNRSRTWKIKQKKVPKKRSPAADTHVRAHARTPLHNGRILVRHTRDGLIAVRAGRGTGVDTRGTSLPGAGGRGWKSCMIIPSARIRTECIHKPRGAVPQRRVV